MILQFILLTIGFVILVKGADWLVKGAVSVAKHYNISELAIGLTIVAFGTSAPELVVNIVSSIKGYNDVTMGNVVGSNLFNLMLILGISGVVFPLSVKIKTIWNEIPFSLFAAILLLILANYTSNDTKGASIGRLDGIVLLIFFVCFMVYIFVNLRKNADTLESGYSKKKPFVSFVFIVIGLISLVLGSRLVIDNAVKVAQYLGASEKIIGITIVSAGTSLPELMTSVVAAFRKKSDIAIGNIIGSNIFNILLIVGVSSLIAPISYNTSFNMEILLLIIATILLFVFMFSGQKYKLDRWEAGFLLTGYVAYMFYLLQ